MYFRRILFIFSIGLSGSLNLFSQENKSQDSIAPVEGLEQGKYSFSIGVNFGQFINKNEDAYTYYILDDKNIKYNVKLGFGYNVRDMKNVGIGLRYYHDKYDIEYENVVGDTIMNSSLEKRLTTNLYYGISKPLFGSSKVFFISDPSIFLTFGSGESNREFENVNEISKSSTFAISVGLNVGLQVFLSSKMSAQMAVGPVGVGYEWESYTLNGDPNGSSENFFARMSPDIFNLEFSISRYF